MTKKLGETIIISEELLKLYSPISKNVGVDKVYPFIHLAQPYYIEPILGKPLMEDIQHQIEEDDLTEANKALVLKCAMPLAMWTSYLALCNCKDLYPLWRPSVECNCNKYLPTDGDNHRPFKNLIYFPNKRNNDCGCGCNNDYWIAKK